MKRYELLDAVGGIDPTYVETAGRDDIVGKKRVWKTLVPIAACLCLAVGMISIVKYAQLRKATTPPESTGDGTGASATQASADADKPLQAVKMPADAPFTRREADRAAPAAGLPARPTLQDIAKARDLPVDVLLAQLQATLNALQGGLEN